ncbi:hypothetical protein [Sodaliphilus sp.]
MLRVHSEAEHRASVKKRLPEDPQDGVMNFPDGRYQEPCDSEACTKD